MLYLRKLTPIEALEEVPPELIIGAIDNLVPVAIKIDDVRDGLADRFEGHARAVLRSASNGVRNTARVIRGR